MKILIAADMEGISGVSNWDQVDPSHKEYERFREIMTGDVNAAIEGAVDAGATEISVADGHASGNNILIEELDPPARLSSGNLSPFAMVRGVENGVDGVMFVGYHARAGTKNAILDHTWSGRKVMNLWLNGELMGETGLNAAVCGHFDAPVIMVAGDQAVCAEAQELLGDVEVAVVKQATGRTSALFLPLPESREKICEAAARAVAKLREKEVEPFKVSKPVTARIEFANSVMADAASLLPGSRRVDGRILDIEAPDMATAYKAARAAIALAE